MLVPYRIPTGCKTIDRVLEGGPSSNNISLVYGEEETGKTTFALQCAANCARQGFKVLFIDCDSTFYAKRLSQIASEEFEKIAEQIILTRPTDFSEQTMIIDHLSNYVTKTFGLVVVDTITSLYRAKVSESPGKAFELNRELNRQLASLAQFVKIHKIAILMNSQVRTAFNVLFEDRRIRVTRVSCLVRDASMDFGQLIVNALLFIFPAYCANAIPVIAGGGLPIDFGKKLGDGQPIFGQK